MNCKEKMHGRTFFFYRVRPPYTASAPTLAPPQT